MSERAACTFNIIYNFFFVKAYNVLNKKRNVKRFIDDETSFELYIMLLQYYCEFIFLYSL